MTVWIQLNGEEYELQGSTLADLIEQLGYPGKRFAVEVNREIISKSEYPNVMLKNDDTVEIVHAIGGG